MRSGLIFVRSRPGMRGVRWDRFPPRACRKHWAQLTMPRDAFIHERFTRDIKTTSSSSHWHLGRKAAGIDAEINEWVDDDSADERADDDYHFKLRAPILEVPFKTAVKYTVRNL
jgi:hypothetical protein